MGWSGRSVGKGQIWAYSFVVHCYRLYIFLAFYTCIVEVDSLSPTALLFGD